MSEEFYQTKESVEQYLKAAEGHDGSLLIAKLNNYLQPNASLLEIGSGPGADWKILSENYKVTGSDNSLEFLKHLKSKYPKGDFIELDAASFNTSKTFDGIYSNKVLHHLKDEELKKSFERQHQLLNPDGVICHSFWLGSGTEDFNGMFVNYHSEDELKDLFSNSFEILHMEKYKEFEEEDSILLIGKKK